MANTYKNIVITPNTGSSTGDPTVVFSGGNTTVNTDITLRVYPDSNGTLSFEGAAGQLFSITNDLTNTIFSVNDVSGIPLIEVNVTSQQITFGEFYGNVGVGRSAATSSTYKLDVNGTINASNVLVNGSPISASLTPANNYAGVMANSANGYAETIVASNLVTSRAYTNTSTTAANNYAGVMANSGNSWTQTIVDANLVTARAYTNTSTTAANNYAGAMANSANAYAITIGASSNAWANSLGVNTSLAYTWSNTQTFSSNVFYRNTSNIVWITNAASSVSNVTLKNYPDSNGTLSFEGSAGQLFSITNDLTGSLFSVNDVSGIPLLEINVASQQITLGQFYGNVGIGTGASNVSNYKLDVIGGANISLPNLTVGGTNVSAAIVAANANAATLSANVNVLAAAVVANDASQGANIATLAASFVSNSQSLSANVNTLAAALVLANTSAHADIDALSVVANAKVSSVTGTSGRITSSGGTAPAIDLATAGAGAATYSSGISAVTVDAYGRVTSVTGSAGYLTTTDFNTANANSVSQSANVNVLAANVNTLAGAAYPKTGGTISGDATITGNLTVSGTTTYVNTQTLLIGDNLVTLNADLPGNVQPTENSGLEVNRGARNSNAAFIWNETGNSWQFTSNTLAGVYSIVASQTDANNVGAAANNFAAATYLTQSTFNSANANSVSQSANVNTLAASFVSNSQSLSANVNTLAATFVSNSQSLSANVNTLAATFVSANANTVSLSANVNVLAAAVAARVTSVSGTSGRITSSGGTAPTIDLATAGAGAATYSSGISSVTVDAYGRVTSVTGSAGYVTSSGVTSVSGTGTVSGLTLSGTVTSTGSLTLGGTLSASVIDNMTDEHRLFNNMGDNHGTRTAFDATSPSYNFGWRYVQGNTNGPGVNSATQYYSEYVGLGNDYPATGAGSYGMHIAYPRNVTTPYISIRYVENNALGAWQKISAGYADAAPWSGITGKPTTVSGFGITDAVTSVTGTSGRITSSGGTTPAIDLATAGAGAASYSSGISAITVDAYGRVTAVTGSAGYATTGQLANYLPLAGGTLTGRVIQSASGFGVGTDDTINSRIDSGFWQTSNAQTANGWPESTATWYHLITSTHSNDANYYSMQFAGSFFDSNALYYRATNNSGTTAWNKLWHAGNDGSGSGLDADTVDGIQASSFYLASNPSGYVTSSGVTSITAGTGLSGGTITSTGTISLPSTGPGAGSYSSGISAITIDAQGRITAITGSAGYITSSSLSAYAPLAGATFTGLITGKTDTAANTSVANDTGSMSIRGSTTAPATVSFHRAGAYAVNMGLDTDNVFRIGGWSDGVNTYRLQLQGPGGTHTFNGTVAATTFSGAGTSLTGTAASLTAGNATTAGGFTPSQTNGVGSRIVVADGSGYINNNYFNSTDDVSAGTVSYIMAKFGDNYYRSATAAKVATFLASQSFASPTFTGTGSVTGGFNVTPGNLGTISSGTTTLSAGSGNYQYYTNGGAHTIAAPGSDCAIDILVTNSATAGAITLSGFTAPTGGGGDTYATTNANRYILSVRRINAISTYVWKALQ